MWKIFTLSLSLLLFVSCGTDVKKIQDLENELDKTNQPLQLDTELDDEDLVIHHNLQPLPDSEEEIDQPTTSPVIITVPTNDPLPGDVITNQDVPIPSQETPQDINEDQDPIEVTDLPVPVEEISEQEELTQDLEEERANYPCNTFEYDEQARRKKLEKIITNEDALEELIDIEQFVCNTLSDDNLHKWINSRAYAPNEYTVIKHPKDVPNTKKNYYKEFLNLTDLGLEMEYYRCRGVYYVNGPYPEYDSDSDSEKHNGYMIRIKGRYFGLWSHCGYPADILLDLVGEAQIKRIEAVSKISP